MSGAKQARLPAEQATDQELVAGCLSGDSMSWELLLRRYERLIYSVPVRYKFDIEERQDIFQTVCCEILKNLHALIDLAKLRTWILTITIRQCNHLVRTKYLQRLQDTVESAHDIKDPNADSFEIYLRSEREQLLREVFDELPERCSRVLRMFFLCSTAPGYQEVGRQLGLSPETIGSLRHRCLKKMGHLLESKGFRKPN